MAPASLVERLDYGSDARLLIVNCDDLGSSHSANFAIQCAMTEGVATSATLMVPCPWAREAATLLAGADIGVHLTFTAEYPGYRWRSLTGGASLHDADGFLPATAAAVIAQATPEDIRAEGRAQIEQAMAWGVDVTHLDSHMGVVQIDSTLFDIYLDLATEFALPIRMFGARTDAAIGFGGRAPAAARGVVYADRFLDPWGRDLYALFQERIASLAPGVAEIYGHQMEDGPELRAQDPDSPEVRAADARTLTDREIASLIAAAGVTPISYRPLRDLQRGG